MYMNFNSDFESQMNTSDKQQSFSQNMRKGFITKVYGILSVQLAVTVLFCLLSMSIKGFQTFQIEHSILFII